MKSQKKSKGLKTPQSDICHVVFTLRGTKLKSCLRTEHTGHPPACDVSRWKGCHSSESDPREAGEGVRQAFKGDLPVPTDRLGFKREVSEECFMRYLKVQILNAARSQAEAPTGCAVESQESTPPPEIRQTGVRVTVTREPPAPILSQPRLCAE